MILGDRKEKCEQYREQGGGIKKNAVGCLQWIPAAINLASGTLEIAFRGSLPGGCN